MTREEVKMAFREAIASEYDPVLAKYEGENTAFSQEFLDKMDRLIRKNKSPLWHLVNTAPKRLILVLIIVLVTLFSAESIPEVRAFTTEFIKTIFPDHVDLDRNQNDYSKTTVFYSIINLPEEYSESFRRQSQKSSQIEYMDSEGNLLCLEQWSSLDDVSLSYDNEHGALREILLNDRTAYYYKHENMMAISWTEDDIAITLSCYGGLTEEEFLKIAVSLEKAEQ